MGGFYKLIVREKDGTIHKQEMTTGGLPFFFKDVKFIDEDPEHLKEFMWCEEENVKKTNEPVHYGIVVLDYMTKTVLNCQAYSDFTFLPNYLVRAYAKNDLRRFQCHGYNEEEAKQFGEIFRRGKVVSYNLFTEDSNISKKIPIDSKDVKLLKELCNKEESSQIEIAGFNIDMKPFKYKRFSEDKPEGILKLKQKMLELGFTFTARENKLWDKFLKERFTKTKR